MLLDILLAIPAGLILFAAMEFAIRLVAYLRGRDYARNEDKASKDIRTKLALPPYTSEPWPSAIEPTTRRFKIAHQSAVDEQGKYHGAVVRSAACLALTFLAMAIAQTWLHENHVVLVILAWIEVFALVTVLMNWRAGRLFNRTWVARRIDAELLRQDQFIGLLMPDTLAGKAVDDAEASRMAIGQRDGLGVVDAINAYWAKRRQAIEAAPISTGDVTGGALLRYLQTRPARQLGWFSDSIARLEHNAHAREQRLRILFSLALTLAVIKLGLVLAQGGGEHHASSGVAALLAPFVAPALMIVTGWSAVEAVYYLNQNARSLIHRYRSQITRMGHWFERAKTELPLDKLPDVDLDPSTKNKARTLALEFEDLMVEELIDWIHIAKRDTIEIAP